MAQTGFTPIQLYSSSTTGNTPAAADLLNSSGGSELAINIFDGKLFYKDSSGNVQVIGWKVVPVSAGGTGQTSYTDGQLLIGNTTGNTLTKATLTAGSGVTITNGAGAITINATGTGGTVTSVAALTLGTTGTDLSSTVANGTTTPVITLNVPTASATNRGALSAADWTTFNNKQPAGTYVTNLTGPITSVGNATSIASQTGTGTTFAMSASPTFTGTVGAADLTTTGNTILGNASTDTLNVGNGDLVKDASGNVLVNLTSARGSNKFQSLGSLTAYTSAGLSLFCGNGASALGSNGPRADINVLLSNNWKTNLLFLVNTTDSDVAPIEVGRFNSDGGFRTLNTIGVGNATPSTSGAGITFPATQSASTDANTLDDYEEGTWTPTDGSGAGLTFTAASGVYVKIGRIVTVQCGISYPTNSSTAGARMNGLPFTTSTSNGGGFSMYCSTALGIAVRNQSSSTNTFFTNITSQATNIQNVQLSGVDIQITFTYQI